GWYSPRQVAGTARFSRHAGEEVMADTLADTVIRIVAVAKDLQSDEISLETTFEELEIDSLQALGIIADIEQEFNIEISNDEAAALRSVGDVVVRLRTRVAAG